MRKRITTGCLILIGILCLSPVPGYYTARFGYCHSWWGKESLLMRSWWLCSCSPGFEQTLYPDHIEVMYPACENVSLRPIAGGTHFLVSYQHTSSYLLDGITGESIPFQPPSGVYRYNFLTPELLLVHIETAPRQIPSNMALNILNWQDGSSATVQRLDAESLPSIMVNGSVNPEITSLFEKGEQIIVFDRFTQAVVSTSTDLEESGDIFYISEAVSRTVPTGWLQTAVEASNVPYIQVFGGRLSEELYISPDGRYTAEDEGIFDAATEQLVAPSYNRLQQGCVDMEYGICFPEYRFCCWLPDSSGAIYTSHIVYNSSSRAPRAFVGAPGQDERGYWLPILKVRVPEDS